MNDDDGDFADSLRISKDSVWEDKKSYKTITKKDLKRLKDFFKKPKKSKKRR